MSSKNKGKFCPKCLNDSVEIKKTMNNHSKEDLKDFSEKIGEKLKKSNDKSVTHKKK